MDPQTRLREAFLDRLGVSPSENVPLSALSSFGIGGPADLFFEARTEAELETAVSLAVSEKYPFYVIGGGYNLLFDDAGYRGLIVRNRLDGVVRDGHRLNALSGTGLACVLREALEAGLTGLEFLAGIPGTVGGAVYGNAGAYGWSIGDVLETATLSSRPDGRKVVPRDALGFGYRDSALKKGGAIVLSAVLLCSPGDRQESEARIRGYPPEEVGQAPPPRDGLRRQLLQEFLRGERGPDRRRTAPRPGRRQGARGRRRRRLRRPLQFHRQQGECPRGRRPRPGRPAQGIGLQDLRRPSRGGGHLPSSRRFNALTRPAGSPFFSARRRIRLPRAA